MESVWRQYLKPLQQVQTLSNVSLRAQAKQSQTDPHKVIPLDIVVIGGGIAGIMCAYMLSKSGHKVTLIEAHKILEGVTCGTTAKITALQSNYQNIPTKKRRRLYFQSQIEAVEGLADLAKDCDFERVDSYVYGARKQIKKEYKVMRKFAQIEHRVNEHLPFGVHDCIRLENQAQFNPIKFCYGLLGGFDIIENCRIKKVKLSRKRLKTEDKVFKYKRLVIATGFPIVNIRGLYAFKMHKSSSYAVCIRHPVSTLAVPARAATPLVLEGTIYNAIADDGLMYRECADGIIIDGLGHRTGKMKCDSYFDILKQELKKVPSLTRGVARSDGVSDYKWAANDCMTFDKIPYAGRLLRFRARGVYVITGFGKWGMTNSFVCAKIVDDMINKRKNRYRRLYKPTRVLNIKVWPAFLGNFLQDGLGLLAGLFSSGKRRCPHMGCRLKFNKNTQTYDCPCHGSRFTKSGDIIVSPAVDANASLMIDANEKL